MSQDPLLTNHPVLTVEGDFSASPTPGPADAETDASAPPAEGSNAAATLDFARNLVRVRESRGLDHGRLSALTMMLEDDKKTVSADSIKEYERGDYRPKQPKLWGLAQALDIMPIMLGPSMTQGEDGPPTTQELLRKKGSRTTRLQKLVELLTDDSQVSTFAELVGMEVAEVYAVASSEVQLGEEQLEPFLLALPRVRRVWLISGQGEPLGAAPSAPAAAPVEAAPVALRAPEPTFSAFAPAPLAAPSVEALRLAVPAVAGAPVYVQLGLGLVAEVDAVLLAGTGAVTGFRLLAGAGVVPALTSADQMERLFHALHGVLDQRSSS